MKQSFPYPRLLPYHSTSISWSLPPLKISSASIAFDKLCKKVLKHIFTILEEDSEGDICRASERVILEHSLVLLALDSLTVFL